MAEKLMNGVPLETKDSDSPVLSVTCMICYGARRVQLPGLIYIVLVEE